MCDFLNDDDYYFVFVFVLKWNKRNDHFFFVSKVINFLEKKFCFENIFHIDWIWPYIEQHTHTPNWYGQTKWIKCIYQKWWEENLSIFVLVSCFTWLKIWNKFWRKIKMVTMIINEWQFWPIFDVEKKRMKIMIVVFKQTFKQR